MREHQRSKLIDRELNIEETILTSKTVASNFFIENENMNKIPH